MSSLPTGYLVFSNQIRRFEHGSGEHFVFTKPASQRLAQRVLNDGARAIDLVGRGAARELAHLGSSTRGTNFEAARVGQIHDRSSFNNGITDEYTEAPGTDIWEARLISDLISEQEHPIQVSPGVY
ncbi:hypothetical protein F53441_8143 [Fusarium austroafricanum]|uniref:Uncharacterized protein n=1 Tax=Fusarium austroafricanum TaxID=2364996 RepID=A0A8H4KC01_9HYPO|nr:hypothetical protein F53441_8143 [Fusarium austroafricanum]